MGCRLSESTSVMRGPSVQQAAGLDEPDASAPSYRLPADVSWASVCDSDPSVLPVLQQHGKVRCANLPRSAYSLMNSSTPACLCTQGMPAGLYQELFGHSITQRQFSSLLLGVSKEPLHPVFPGTPSVGLPEPADSQIWSIQVLPHIASCKCGAGQAGGLTISVVRSKHARHS